MRGRFITFEGGEGSGKSTQARRLVEHLRGAGLSVVETREPGGSPFAERVRALILDPAVPPHAALAEALLFSAARADHLSATVRPALAAGSWVVCDRFTDSTRVYQGIAGGLGTEVLVTLERIVVAETRPDLTLLLDLEPALGLARARQRSAEGGTGTADGYEARGMAYHERLRAGFLQLAHREPERIVVLDATATMDHLEAEIRAIVTERLRAA